MSLVVRGGKVLDPASGKQEVMDIVIDEGRITDVGANVNMFESCLCFFACVWPQAPFPLKRCVFCQKN